MLAHINGKKIDETGEDTSCVNKPLYWTSMTCAEAVPGILALGAATCSNYWSVLGITGETRRLATGAQWSAGLAATPMARLFVSKIRTGTRSRTLQMEQ